MATVVVIAAVLTTLVVDCGEVFGSCVVDPRTSVKSFKIRLMAIDANIIQIGLLLVTCNEVNCLLIYL